MASNLHKDLNDLQLHVPKGFASAANSTTCQKDATGNLVWAAGGSGGGVTQIVAGTNVTISPTGGTGAVTINSSSGGGGVTSVNGDVGPVVVLNSDDIAEGATNEYYTDARVDANPDVVANTAKIGITTTQASDITTNNAKIGITTTQASDITTNNAKVSNVQSDWNASTGLAEILNKPTIPSVPVDSVNGQVGMVVLNSDDIAEGSTNEYYTDARVDANPDVVANTAKIGITTTQASDITTNNAKIGITTTQASDITTNNAKVSNVQSDWNASTGLAEILNKPTIPSVPVDSVNGRVGIVVLNSDDIAEGSTNLYYTDARVDANPDVVANTAKVGITPTQSANILLNVDGIADNSIDIAQNALDISNKVSNVQSDWNASSGLAEILNKPTIPSGGVTQIVAGTNVTISPTGGTGAVTINSSGGGGGGTNNVTSEFSFFDSKVPPRDVYIPITGETENTSIQRYGRYVCSYSGQVEKISFGGTANMSGGTGGSIEVRKLVGTGYTSLETISFSSMTAFSTTTLTFTSAASFTRGDILAFWLVNGFGVAYGNISGQMLFSVT